MHIHERALLQIARDRIHERRAAADLQRSVTARTSGATAAVAAPPLERLALRLPPMLRALRPRRVHTRDRCEACS